MTNTKAHVINDAKVNLFQLKVVCSLFLFSLSRGEGFCTLHRKTQQKKEVNEFEEHPSCGAGSRIDPNNRDGGTLARCEIHFSSGRGRRRGLCHSTVDCEYEQMGDSYAPLFQLLGDEREDVREARGDVRGEKAEERRWRR